MYDCHGAGGNQFFALSKNGQLVTKFQDCIGLVNGNVSRKTCADDDKQELWDYDEKVWNCFFFIFWKSLTYQLKLPSNSRDSR